MQVKYQDKQDSPFETHEAIMVLFIVAAFIYTVSFLSSLILIQNHHDYTFYVLPILKQISVVSGTLACDSLILILCPPFGYLVLALCALLALRILIGSYHQIVQLLHDAANRAYEAVASDFELLFQTLHQLYNNIIHVWLPLIPHLLRQSASQVFNLVNYVPGSIFQRN